jgi:predicted transcriptional regulator
MALSEEFDREIERIRASLDLPPAWEPYEGPDDADPVQLSVRVDPGLRHDLAQVAKRRRQSVNAFVTEALEDAVRVARDPFAGIAARMAADIRAEIGKAVESGEYATAAAAADRRESAWTDW